MRNIILLRSTLIIGLMTILMSFGILISIQPLAVNAQSSLACDGLTGATGNANCGSSATDPEPDGLLKTGINMLSIVAGVIAVVMIMIAGLKFITSQGDSGKISSARTTVIYAIIGLVIVALSQTIVFFIVGD